MSQLAATASLFAAHPELLRELGHGIEKESLRVQPSGALSERPHPEALGSALTHPHITTDFSEAQLELITGVHSNVDACLAELDAVHRFVSANIGDEVKALDNDLRQLRGLLTAAKRYTDDVRNETCDASSATPGPRWMPL